jgi:hypothetical protein
VSGYDALARRLVQAAERLRQAREEWAAMELTVQTRELLADTRGYGRRVASGEMLTHFRAGRCRGPRSAGALPGQAGERRGLRRRRCGFAGGSADLPHLRSARSEVSVSAINQRDESDRMRNPVKAQA